MPSTSSSHSTLILVVTQGLWGGAQRYVFDLARHFSETRQYHVVVAVGEPEGAHDLQKSIRAQLPRVEVKQLSHLRRTINPFHDIAAVFELAELYQELKPAIVHLNSSKAGIIGSLASRKVGTPRLGLVYTAHGWVFTEPLRPPIRGLYRLLERITAPDKDAIITVSAADTEVAHTELGLDNNLVSHIPLGTAPIPSMNPEDARVAFSRVHSLPASWSAHDYLIGTIANFYPTKGLDILIRACASVFSDHPNTRLLVIGDGPERKDHESLIHKHGLEDKIHLAGFTEAAERYLPMLKLFVLPSRKEGLPYVLLHATQAGIPCIATAVGGVPDIIEDKKTGLLVPPNDSQALAEAIAYAADHPAELSRMAEAAQKKSSDFSLDQMTTATETVYRHITSRLQEQTRVQS